MDLIVLNDAIYFHKIISFILLLLVISNLCVTLLFNKNFIILYKIIWFTTPLLFGILAIMLISGFSLLAMMKFNFSFIVFYMLFINILILILEIRRVKRIRFTMLNLSNIKSYIRYTIFLYVLYIVFILICSFRF